MTGDYFSDRERGPRSRTEVDIRESAWGGLVALIQGAIANGGFGQAFPQECQDGGAISGTNFYAMGLAVRGDIADIAWPLDGDSTPETYAILDLVEFAFKHIAKAEPGDYHSFYRHHHLDFDKDVGRAEFRGDVNRIFARNQLAYELAEDGRIIRLAHPVLREILTGSVFASGDQKLDNLLETARTRFLDPDPGVRKEALEKLWDAFERLKTVEPDLDKKAGANALIEKSASEPKFKSLLAEESTCLTKIGNRFHIRHSETSQIELQNEHHVDYLFHRLFALVWLLLRARTK